ncbi:hypothetical protein N9J00_02675, partial [Acidimicrobiia bacterium]|nr:hypothetical protein [Acidimicrobiia bacterium]
SEDNYTSLKENIKAFDEAFASGDSSKLLIDINNLNFEPKFKLKSFGIELIDSEDIVILEETELQELSEEELETYEEEIEYRELEDLQKPENIDYLYLEKSRSLREPDLEKWTGTAGGLEYEIYSGQDDVYYGRSGQFKSLSSSYFGFSCVGVQPVLYDDVFNMNNYGVASAICSDW